jgi:hypothetical protein
VVIVDSGPSDEGQRIVQSRFPRVRFERTPQRLLPHAARNRGVELAAAQLIVFTDPDIYPKADWLACLVEAHQRTKGIVVGAVDCHGRRWLDLGIHLAKFDMWLPGSPAGTASIAPTLNLLCPRRVFEHLGGFPGDVMIGDTLFSWIAVARGYRITFEPRAVVDHHHLSSWGQLLGERLARGAEFGMLRVEQGGWGGARVLVQLAASILPIRLIRLMVRTLRHAGRAGVLGVALSTSPVIVTAHAAWLAGESRAFISFLSGARWRRGAAENPASDS